MSICTKCGRSTGKARLTVVLEKSSATVGGVRVPIPKSDVDVLRVLISNLNEPVTAATLMETLNISSLHQRQTVHRLRRAFRDAGAPVALASIGRDGYMLVTLKG